MNSFGEENFNAPSIGGQRSFGTSSPFGPTNTGVNANMFRGKQMGSGSNISALDPDYQEWVRRKKRDFEIKQQMKANDTSIRQQDYRHREAEGRRRMSMQNPFQF